MKIKYKSVLGFVIVTALIFVSTPISASTVPTTKEMSSNVSETLVKNVPEDGLKPGTLGGEWTVIALARAEYDEPYIYDSYYNNVAKEVENDKGILSDYKYTEYSRVTLGLTAIGRNPRNVGGYDLIQPLADFSKVEYQGINGPIWALTALDSKNYDMPKLKGTSGIQNSRDIMVNYILSKEAGKGDVSAGGWALAGSFPDPDITAMAMQALSKYKSRPDVQAAISRAVNVLSELQNNDGGYSSYGAEDSESTAQVIVALAGLGIDPCGNNFVKNGHTLISALAAYYMPGKGFKHTLSESSPNSMSTDQCAYALAAYNRFLSEKNPLYDMTDVAPVHRTLENKAFASDTTSDFSVKGTYVFKITCKNGNTPDFAIGTPGVFKSYLVKISAGNYYYMIKAVGHKGAKAGIYINGPKILVASIC